MQLFGSARQMKGADAERTQALYARRLSIFGEGDLAACRFDLFRPRKLKLFDEHELGRGTFVTARVGRDGPLRWERTENYV